jgi:anti-sigma regulatory factor (Ser/Thr protein kinase)
MGAPRAEIRFPATHAGFADGFARLLEFLDVQALSGAWRYNVELVFEELVANVVKHGVRSGEEVEVHVTVERRPDSIELCFDDNGVAFDPRTSPEPKLARSLEEARPGGFGLMLVRRAASVLDYVRTPEGRNRVTLRLRCAKS